LRDPYEDSLRKKESAFEMTATLVGLFAVVVFAPLSTPRFGIAMIVGMAATLLYIVVAGVRNPRNWEEWGFLPHDDAEEDGGYGCVFIGWLMLFSIGFIFCAKFVLPLPHVTQPGGYLLWCTVQDFLFFGVLLRGLLLRMSGVPAVLITAALFAASHYPLAEFMGLTGIVALAWGYVYVKTRWLLPIVVSHWAMGIILLGG
jgi:membrane protease YdiL (CAAX protease family)